MDSDIQFFSEDIEFVLKDPGQKSDWILAIAHLYGRGIQELNYVFCSDEYLHKINVEHLNHDTFTDIITFPLHEEGMDLLSDIFISVDRIKENAQLLRVTFEEELHRVMIHGVLHMCGLGDKTDEEKVLMRDAENNALKVLGF